MMKQAQKKEDITYNNESHENDNESGGEFSLDKDQKRSLLWMKIGPNIRAASR